MPISSFNVLGNPNVGAFLIATDRFLVAPTILTERKVARLAGHLGVKDHVRLRVCGSKLLGVFITANSKGIVVPHLAYDDEVEGLRGLNVEVRPISSRITALGNCVLVNDKGGVVDQMFPRKAIEDMENALGVELAPGTIAGLPYVGSLAVATNSGVVAHPRIGQDEEELIRGALRVPVYKGTVIGGVPYVKVGLIANSHGAVVGRGTTGPELMTIGRALNIS